MPGAGFRFRQFNGSQRLGQITAGAYFFSVRHQAGDRRAIFEQDKCHALIVRTVHAIREVAGGLCDADGGHFHGIRLSEYTQLRKAVLWLASCGTAEAGALTRSFKHERMDGCSPPAKSRFLDSAKTIRFANRLAALGMTERGWHWYG